MSSLIVVMLWMPLILVLAYFMFLAFIAGGWENLRPTEMDEDHHHFITVIVPVRNEETGIQALIESLEKQQYPSERFEVIVIDDHSTDSTWECVNRLKKHAGILLRSYRLPEDSGEGSAPKKKAITFGIEKAHGDIIVLTDGDCRVLPAWLSELENMFRKTDAMLVSGPVFIDQGDSFGGRLQSIEFSSLMGTGASLIYWKLPVMCNGANLAFRRSAFIEVEGYKGNEHILSGDDEFLMYKIHCKYPDSIYFLKSPQALVRTQPVSSLQGFISQRIRWAGKWKRHANIRSTLLAVFIFAVHLAFISLIMITILGKIDILYICGITIVKISMEYFFINRIFKFFNERLKLFPFLVSSLFYSFYAVFFGVLANMGRFTWKGRNFKS